LILAREFCVKLAAALPAANPRLTITSFSDRYAVIVGLPLLTVLPYQPRVAANQIKDGGVGYSVAGKNRPVSFN